MKVLIVEDDILLSEDLKDSIQTLFPNKFNVIHSYQTVKDGLSNIKKNTYQLAIFDINIGTEESGGIELSQYLSSIDPNIPQIFITGLPDDKGFEKVKPLLLTKTSFLFLKKPFDEGSLFRAIALALGFIENPSQIEENQAILLLKALSEGSVWVTTERSTYEKIILSELCYLQSDGHYIRSILASGKKSPYFLFGLKDFYYRYLSHFPNFFYLNRSVIINLHFVDSVVNSQVFIRGQAFSIPKNKKELLFKLLGIDK